MRRGFKTEAERLANDCRSRLGCGKFDPAPLAGVAAELGAEIVSAADLVAIERLEELKALQDDALSAGTFRRRNGRKVIVFNPLHEEGRRNSDIAHELAHLLLGHNVRTIESVGDVRFLTCDREQEEEADWLGGCLLLPRDLLVKAAFAKMGPAEIAATYKTSEQMAKFRLNASGVLVMVGRAEAKKRR
jgi:Zn-dependent peptidase ImmA (M78 family)